MDISGVSPLKTEWQDLDDGFITITIKDSLDVVLGTLVLDKVRLRSTMEMLGEIARVYSPDTDVRQNHITHFNHETNTAETTFNT